MISRKSYHEAFAAHSRLFTLCPMVSLGVSLCPALSFNVPFAQDCALYVSCGNYGYKGESIVELL